MASTACDQRASAGEPRPLTGREYEVLRAVGRGLSDAEIAATLAIPESAVAGQLGRLRARLGLRDRAAAIVYAFDNGIVTPRRQPGRVLTMPVREATLPEPRLRINLLGPLRVWWGTEQVDVGPLRQQALLAALVLRAGSTVSQRELLDGVWGAAAPAGNVVPVYVYRLRRSLPAGSVISRDRSGYRFGCDTARLDTMRVEEIAADGDAAEAAGDLDAAVDEYGRALELFQGEPLAGLPGPFAELERQRLTERRIALTLRRTGWQLRLGRHADAVAELRVLATEHPYDESVAAALMHALHGSGRQEGALRVFTEMRDRLVRDLGVEPGRHLRRAQLAVLRAE